MGRRASQRLINMSGLNVASVSNALYDRVFARHVLGRSFRGLRSFFWLFHGVLPTPAGYIGGQGNRGPVASRTGRESAGPDAACDSARTGRTHARHVRARPGPADGPGGAGRAPDQGPPRLPEGGVAGVPEVGRPGEGTQRARETARPGRCRPPAPAPPGPGLPAGLRPTGAQPCAGPAPPVRARASRSAPSSGSRPLGHSLPGRATPPRPHGRRAGPSPPLAAPSCPTGGARPPFRGPPCHVSAKPGEAPVPPPPSPPPRTVAGCPDELLYCYRILETAPRGRLDYMS
ncbi:basic proline-rich protein-like [Penaeus indicus]|uniref:basic proline-rich protein-like n=1 Tax=Penaeus indicus TaxID=29960 RepID=UPI00300BFA23